MLMGGKSKRGGFIRKGRHRKSTLNFGFDLCHGSQRPVYLIPLGTGQLPAVNFRENTKNSLIFLVVGDEEGEGIL
jgi:hypothetical protein